MPIRPFALVLAAALPAGALTLAENGRASAVIVRAATARTSERTAAAELADWLGRVTGATFEIVDEAAAPAAGAAILVGPTAFAADHGGVPEGPEEWAVRTVGERLILTGGWPRGTLYAVYRFLEDEVGVRWWNPWEESVPSRPTLVIGDLDRSGRPAFRYRDVYDEYAGPNLYAVRNRINGHFANLTAEYGGTMAYGPPYHVHTFYLYVPPAEYFAAHPEWFSLVGGERRAEHHQLCLTNPELLGFMKQRLRRYIEESHAAARATDLPPPQVFGVSQNDWGGQCQCERCQAIVEREGSEAGVLLEFINQLADDIRDDYPDVFIDTLAYQYTLNAPRTVKPRDNVIIRLCDLSGSDFARSMADPANQAFADQVIAWSKIAKNLRIWDYAVTYGDTHGMPFPSLPTMPIDYRFFLEHHVEGMFIEHEYPVEADLHDLKAWVQAKLLEDPYRDYDALVRDFTDGYYGPAGTLVRDYLAALEASAEAHPSYIGGWTGAQGYRYLDLDFMTRAHAIFDQAERVVADDATLLRRVRHARLPLDRATALRWSTLCREHVARGGAAETMPLDLKQVILPRIHRTVEEQVALRIPEGRRAGVRDRALGGFDALAAMPSFPALPTRFRDRPPGTVTDFGPDSFRRWQNICKIVPDPEAQLGVAARLLLSDVKDEEQQRYRPTDAAVTSWGIYDNRLHKGVLSAAIPPDAVTDGGYHWYRLSPTRIGPGYYVYFFWSWIIQVDIDAAMADDPDAEFEVWASLKFDGPWFPHGDPNEPNAIWVERLCVVRR